MLLVDLTVWRSGVSGFMLWVTLVSSLAVLGLVTGGLVSIHRERVRLERTLDSLELDGDAAISPGRFTWLRSAVRRLNERLDAYRDRLGPLRRERDRFRAVLDGFEDGLVLLGPDDEVRYVNGTARELLDLPESSAGRTIQAITRSDDVTRAVRTARDEDRSVERRITRVEPDRETVLRLHAFPSNGELVLAVRDVTRLHQLQTVRQDFVANVSHELKTPLAAIRGLVETLRDDGEMDADTRRRFLDRVGSQVRSMTELVQDLLTLSRLEGKQDVEEESVDVRGPVGDAVDSVRPRAREKSIELDVSMSDEPLEMAVDRTAVRQMVGNLVDNAVKYTPEGGTVRVGVDGDEAAVRFEVEDNGVGIEPRDQERIFERFYRVDEARARGTRDEASTGLGLAIVKHVVQSMEGRLDLESTPGRGSRFTVTVPRNPDDAPAT